MKNLVRIGVALSAAVGFSALVGAQSASAAPKKSYLGVYQALNQTVSEFSVGFTVPKFKCTAANDAIDIYANAFDDSPGTPGTFDGAFVQLSCTTKLKPVVTPILEVDGIYTVESGLTVQRKDVVDLTVTCGAAGGSAALDDVTSGQSQSLPTPAGSSCNGVFLGNIGLSNKAGKIVPLPKFGSVVFGDAEVNGAPLGDASPAPTSVNFYEGKTQVITVGPLTDGGSEWVNTQKS
jgi:hypothetical protein